MRGDAERECFEIVKARLRTDVYFAMSYLDDEVIEKAFGTAVENPQKSEFPDFIFEDGFIEHFRVTSSAEGKKGSTMAIENSEINRDFAQRAKSAAENLPNDRITIQSVETSMVWHMKQSYENFVDSFKSNFNEHLKSLNKYTGSQEHGIFMIEYADSALCMSRRYTPDLMLNVSYGDLIPRENPAYRLSRDMDLLQYVYEKRDAVEFVVFVNRDCFHGMHIDIIKASNALEVIKLLHEGYDFHCANMGSSKFGIGIALPNSIGDKYE